MTQLELERKKQNVYMKPTTVVAHFYKSLQELSSEVNHDKNLTNLTLIEKVQTLRCIFCHNNKTFFLMNMNIA